MNLYEISSRLQELLNLEELTDEEAAELGALSDNAEEACIYRAKNIRNLQAELAAVITARKEMQEREKRLAKMIDRQEDFLCQRMTKMRLTKINAPEFAIGLRRNPISVVVNNEDFIPDKFWISKETVTESIDKGAIKQAIELGEIVPGVCLVQHTRIEFK